LIAAGCETKAGADKVLAKESVKPASLTQDKDNGNRLQWNLETLVTSYLQKGHRNVAWDDAATNALARFALARSGNRRLASGDDEIPNHCRAAISKGCNDPVVLYLQMRLGLLKKEGATDEMLAEGYKKALEASRQYPCAPIRLYYLALRASEALNAVKDRKAFSSEVRKLRQMAVANLTNALEDPAIPPIEVYEACRDLINALERSPQQLNEFCQATDAIVMRRWPNSAFAHLLQGQFYITAAWGARGFGYANTVPDEGWKLFREYLEDADAALDKAWKLDSRDPKIATEMLRVELGQGKGRDRMELWFGRAMALDTNFYEACFRKLYYLEPKWHGSAEDMLAFARECVASKTWGGNIPLITLDAHTSLAKYDSDAAGTNYWKQPIVWRDIQSAFEKFFSLNPNAIGWRHDYAKYAYQCEQWDVFKKQIKFFQGTNYYYFGGRENFDRMVSNADRKTAASRPR
jgi:hypothetical protein